MTDFPDVKLKAQVSFPARVDGGAGIDVTKSNGNYQFNLDFGDFAPPVIGISDTTHQNLLVWNSVTGAYTLAPVGLFGLGTAISEAPSDGVLYGRRNVAWIPAAPINSPALTGLPTAPTITLTPPATNKGLVINQSTTGSVPFTAPYGFYDLNKILVSSDNTDAALGINAVTVDHYMGGAATKGVRNAGYFAITQTAPTRPTNPFHANVGMIGIAFASGAGDGGTNTGAGAKGTYFGENPQVRSTATNVWQLCGSESDIFGTAAATQKYQVAYSAVGIFVNPAAALDAAYEIHSGGDGTYGPCQGWGFGFVAAELNNGLPPIKSTGTLLGGYVESLSTIPVAYGIDLRKFTPSQYAYISNGASIDAAGAGRFVGVTSGANFTATGTPQFVPTLTCSDLFITVNNASSLPLAGGNGLMVVKALSTNHHGLYLLGAGTGTLVGSVGTTFVAPTITPAAGKASIMHDGSVGFRIYNNIGSTQTFVVCSIWTGGA